jgi:class 3 adenylate cyclase
MTPERTVRYVESGGVQIAYEVVSEGPLDLVVAFDWASNIDLLREFPRSDRLLRRLSELGRLILFDMRGVGLSDPVDSLPVLEEWVDDVQAVLDVVGSERHAMVGFGQAAQLCMLYAAMHPDETTALVTVNGFACLRHAPDYPWGFRPEAEQRAIKHIQDRWGSGDVLGFSSPGVRDVPGGPEWLARLERAVGSPRRVAIKQQLAFAIDVRDVLAAITVPTLVLHSDQNRFVGQAHADYLVKHIAGARLQKLPGADHAPGAAEDADALMGAIEEFLTGSKKAAALDRALMTVAFTDIVGSTEMAAELGDRRWRSLLGTHESVSRREIDGARGRVVKFTGDGVMATFDGPARAVQCMRSIGDELEPFGLPLRAGVHTGEVELIGDDIGGIAVHIAARVAALAGAGEVLVSSTVRDLVAGSGLVFEDRGERSLKGVPDPWHVFAAVDH